MAHDIFISYSKKDIDFARHLRKLLQQANFSVWMDENEIDPGEDWWETIEQNIKAASAVVVVMSPNSRDSRWVKRELLAAENYHKTIFPILLAGEVWSRLADIQAEDMTASLKAKLPSKLNRKLYEAIHSAPPPVVQAAPVQRKNRLGEVLSSPLWQGIGGIVGIIGVILAFLALRGVGSPPLETPTPAPTTEVAIAATHTPTDEPTLTPTSVPPTPTQTPIPPSATSTVTPTGTQTPEPSATPTDQPTSMPRPTDTSIPPSDTPATQLAVVANSPMLTIFRDNDTLTVFLPSPNPNPSLEGVTLQVVGSTGEVVTYRLDTYPAFLGVPFGNLPTPICFRLMRSGTSLPVPLECPTSRLFNQPLADADVFWYERATGQSRIVTVLQEGVVLGICAAGQATCVVGEQVTTQAAQPTVVAAIEPPQLPCEGMIVNPDSAATVFNLTVYRDVVGGDLTATSFRDGQEIVLQRHTIHNNLDVWYLIYDDNQRLGWLSSKYIILTAKCFG